MELHTDYEVLDMLCCLTSSVWEFAEMGRNCLNELGDEQRDFVYSLLCAPDSKTRYQSLYAITRQKTWRIPETVVEKIRTLFFEESDNLNRQQALLALSRNNAPKEYLREALMQIVRQERVEDMSVFVRAAVESDLLDECDPDLASIKQKYDFLDSMILDVAASAKKWCKTVENIVRKKMEDAKLLDREFWCDYLNLFETSSGITRDELTRGISISISNAREYNVLPPALRMAGESRLLENVLYGVLEKIKLFEDDGTPIDDYELFDTGCALARFHEQVEPALSGLWKQASRGFKSVILSFLVHSKDKVKDKSLVANIVSETFLAPQDNLNFILAIAVNHHYRFSGLSFDVKSHDLFTDDHDGTTRRIGFWIARREIARSFEFMRNITENECESGISMLLLARNQYWKILEYIDKSIINRVMAFNPENAEVMVITPLQITRFLTENQKSMMHASSVANQLASNVIDHYSSLDAEANRKFHDNW